MSNALLPGDLLPARRLTPVSGGPPVRVGPHRLRSSVIVVAHPGPCDACFRYLVSLADASALLTAEKGEVMAVVGPGWQPRQPGPALSFPVLVDDGVVGARLAPDGTPVVAVADRFGHLFARFDAGPDHAFPALEQVVASLLDIGIQCPECGVPDVPSVGFLAEPGDTSGGVRLA